MPKHRVLPVSAGDDLPALMRQVTRKLIHLRSVNTRKGVRTIDRKQMVDRLNTLQRLLKSTWDPVEREQIQMGINALTSSLKQKVHDHNAELEKR